MTRSRWLGAYGVAVGLVLLGVLFARRAAIAAGEPSPFDLAILVILAALALAPLFTEVSIGGIAFKRELKETEQRISGDIAALRGTIISSVAVSPTVNVQLQQLAQREVSRAQEAALRLLSQADIDLIPLWEAENSSVPAADKRATLSLLEQRVAEIEAQAARVPLEERVHYQSVLRTLYWKMLEAGYRYYASNSDYQAIKRRVVTSLGTLGRAEPGTA